MADDLSDESRDCYERATHCAQEAAAQTDPTLKLDHRQKLSVRVFENGSVFGWTLTGPANEILGRGTAETELKARIEAFRAGMIYIDRSKSRFTTGGVRFH